MRSYVSMLKRVLLEVIHNKALKKIKPMRILLRFGASGLVNLLTTLKGLKFLPQWGWYPKLIFLLELYEPRTTSLCKRIVKPGMVVLDIGANIGYYTILFSKLVGPDGKVYAFEPIPGIFQLLKYNVRGFKNVTVLQKAVSNTNGKVELFLSKKNTGSHGFYVPNEFRVGSCKVDVVRLDDFIANEVGSQCNFVKIDVEGAEPLVIEGMTNLIRQSQRLIVVLEFNHTTLRLAHTNPDEFLKVLHKKFDAVYCIDEENGSLRPATKTACINSIPEWHAVNLLCCKGGIKL